MKWTKVNHEYESENEELMQRKLVAVMLLNSLVKTLGRFAVNYYGYMFDYYLGLLEHTQSNYKGSETGKRTVAAASSTFIELHALTLQSLDLLFQNDKRGFVDNLKFEKLVKPLTGQLVTLGLRDNYHEYSMEYLVPAIISLINLVNDDYMWKTLLFQVCTHSRSSSLPVRLTVAQCSLRIVDSLAERFVIILNDFIPYLSQMLDDEEPEVSSTAKSIVKQLEQYSSEDIFGLIKAAY